MIGDRTETTPRRRPPSATRERVQSGQRARSRVPRRLPRPGPRALGAVVAAIVLAAGAWLWLRDSSLVSVRQVTIAGVSGPDAGQIRSALNGAARGMTTLDVKMGALQTAVAPYPVVRRLQVSTSFPHRMRIQVIEEVPVAWIDGGGREIAVTARGDLLRDPASTGSLPTIDVTGMPADGHVSGTALAEVRLAGAAPYALLGKVGQITTGGGHGLIAQLRNGPRIYFGTATQLSAKWAAAAAVLASSTSAGAVYIDVTDPARPAAGTGSDSGSDAASGATSDSTGATSDSSGSASDSTSDATSDSTDSTSGSTADSTAATADSTSDSGSTDSSASTDSADSSPSADSTDATDSDGSPATSPDDSGTETTP